jgi:hypothetical protein
MFVFSVNHNGHNFLLEELGVIDKIYVSGYLSIIADKIWYLVTSKVQRINEQQPYKIFRHKKLHNEKMRNLQHVSESLLDLSL